MFIRLKKSHDRDIFIDIDKIVSIEERNDSGEENTRITTVNNYFIFNRSYITALDVIKTIEEMKNEEEKRISSNS